MLQLSEEEVRETLQRAREIADQGRALAGPQGGYEVYLHAGEEVGIPREALMQALRERHAVPLETLAAGQTVFAPSVDGHWYPAVLSSLDAHSATVRFVNGGEHTCAANDLRPLTLVPGRKLEADWPGWGWFGCTVEKYNPDKGTLTLTDGWSKKSLPLEKVRLPKREAAPLTTQERRIAAINRIVLTRCALLAGSAGIGLGFLLARFLPQLLPFLG